jgi:hypothetical protein
MRFPDDTNRHAIIGATGSGKTQAALWHLSHRNFHTQPWLVYNFKGDESIDGIPHARRIGVEEIPVKPGIYITDPHPAQVDEVEAQMWAIWKKGETGVYVDEGYMIGRNNQAFRSLLTQGRSKRIPMMVLSQRPVWLDRFVFSESEYFQVFRLQHKKDVKNVQEFITTDVSKRLPEYHSYYYDVGSNTTTILKPVPDLDTIYATFDRRLRRQKQVV